MTAFLRAGAPGPPRFDRASALGWKDVALDGLSCYLRCVEAVLRWQGLDRDEVAIALCGPVDLLRRRRNGSHYDGLVVDWEVVEDGHVCWSRLAGTLARDLPVIITPDRFYWPGDEFEGRRHFHDHTVLAFELCDDVLRVLDTDAPAEHAYVRELPVTIALRRACGRWAVVRAAEGEPPATLEHFIARVLAPSRLLLALDSAELLSFAERWRTRGLDDVTAHALHVAALGDFQPILFLFAEATYRFAGAGVIAPIADTARIASRRAKSLGLLLLALHRESSSDAYEFALPTFELFMDSLDELHDAIARHLGAGACTRHEPAGKFVRRLEELAGYCFMSTAAPGTG
jgi:hypothetical protein